MNLFQSIGAWFQRDAVKKFLKLALELLKFMVGQAATQLLTIAQEEVTKAETSGKTGDEKWAMAFDGIKKRLPDIGTSQINWAIETAVQALLKAKQ